MDRRDIVVTGFRLNASEPPAKALQRVLGLEESEARALSKRFPCVVRENEEWAEAERLMLALREAGGYVQLREPGRSLPPAALEASPILPPTDVPAAPVPLTPPMAEVAKVLAPLPPEDFGTAPTLFASAPSAPPRVSRYELGELEIAPQTKSQPAPAMTAAKSQPAPAMTAAKSQPAPAMTAAKSQPAPAMTAAKSQPAPAPKAVKPAKKKKPLPAQDAGLEAAGLRMLGDGFEDNPDDDPDFELDERALGHQTNRVQVTKREPRGGAAQETRKRRGLLATLLLPLVLAQAAIPHALALTGVAAASGAAVYIVRTTGQAEEKAQDEDATVSLQAPDKQRAHKKRTGIMGMLDKLTGEDKTDDAQLAGSANDKGLDQPGSLAEGGPKAAGAGATHPLVKMAPKAMEGSIASILRSRIRGVHKVGIKWPEGTRPEGHVECILLEQDSAANLRELASTGTPVPMPVAVRDQMQDHILVLRTADSNPNAGYLPICLAN